MVRLLSSLQRRKERRLSATEVKDRELRIDLLWYREAVLERVLNALS